MNARLGSLGFGATLGFFASLARAPLAASIFDGPVTSTWRGLIWRALPFVAAALAMRFASARREVRPIVLAWGAALGFALHALVLSPWVEISSTLGLVLAFVVAVFVAGVCARAGGDAELDEPPNRRRFVGILVASAAAVVALEAAARPLRQLGSTADDQTVFGLAFVACLAIGAAAFAGLFRGGVAKPALPLLVAAAALGVWVSLSGISDVRTRDGLEAFLRTGLYGLARLDSSRRGMFDVDFLIGARVLVVPAFAWGAALACLRRRVDLEALLVGAALGVLALPLGAVAGRPIPGEEFAYFPQHCVVVATFVAALSALVAAVETPLSKRAVLPTLVACGLAFAAYRLPPRSTVVIAPWDRFPPEPRLWIDHPIGLLTVEPTLDRAYVVALDRRRLTAVGSAARAEDAQITASWRALALPRTGVRVLLIGQLSPERAHLLTSFGATTVDRTGAWSNAMAALEDDLFEGAPKPAGEILSPSAACSRLERDGKKAWDLIWMPATDEGVFDLPSLAEERPPVVAWQPIQTYLADRRLGSADDWSRDVLLACDGIDRIAYGFTDARAEWDGAPAAGVERFRATATRAAPLPAKRLGTRRFQREFDAQFAAMERLENSASSADSDTSKVAQALRLHFAAQCFSSPFEHPAQQVEIDPQTLELLSEVALAHEPGLFVRSAWNCFAAVLTEKRDTEAVFRYVEPVANARPVWPALERAVAEAYLEALDPKTAAEHFERARAAEPFALDGYASTAAALIAAGTPERAIDVLKKALAIQPRRRDWERLLAIAQVRAGDRDGRTLIQTLLLEDPDDSELLPYLGDPPFPDFHPPLPGGGERHH